MSKSENLKAELRSALGTRSARKLRVAGRIPASMDADASAKQHHFSIEEHLFLATRRRHVHLYDIDFGSQVESAVVRELQWDAMGELIVHVDFKRVRRDVETSAEVMLEFTGHPKGGNLNHLVTHVSVLCLPADIPDAIEVPVGHLDTGGAVHAKELVMPKGVKLVTAPSVMICNVVLQKIEVVATPAAEVAAAGSVAGAAAPAGAPGAAAPAPGAKTPAAPGAKTPAPPGAKPPPAAGGKPPAS
jgi:large subunit ribosomal protein L25